MSCRLLLRRSFQPPPPTRGDEETLRGRLRTPLQRAAALSEATGSSAPSDSRDNRRCSRPRYSDTPSHSPASGTAANDSPVMPRPSAVRPPCNHALTVSLPRYTTVSMKLLDL